jgi:hypothetical protein
MTDMQRWLDSGQVQEDVLRRLKAARPLLPLDPMTKARSRRRLVVMTAVPVAASLMFWIKSVALGAVLGSAVTVAIVVPKWQQLLRPNLASHAVPSVSGSKASPRNVASPALIAPDESPLVPQAAPSNAGMAATNAPKSVPTTPANSADPLGREIQLLERARRLIAVDPSRALDTLHEHQREFGNGTLVLERQFLEVEALLRLGRRSEARAQAAVLKQNAPGSLYERRLSQLLDGTSE